MDVEWESRVGGFIVWGVLLPQRRVAYDWNQGPCLDIQAALACILKKQKANAGVWTHVGWETRLGETGRDKTGCAQC